MIMHLLGIMDFLAGCLLLFLKFGIGESIAFWLGIYLIIKGVVFISNIASMMDILAGIMIILAGHGLYFFFTWIFVLWLLQKGFFSFFSA